MSSTVSAEEQILRYRSHLLGQDVRSFGLFLGLPILCFLLVIRPEEVWRMIAQVWTMPPTAELTGDSR